MKKQDTSRDDFYSPLAGGFGKVLGSIQGLQQRLGDFSYGEVSIAEAKVKMLVKQLTLLQDSLDNLVQFKLKLGEIDRQLKAIPAENFDQVNQDDLEKHPRLHAILRASKLISLPHLAQANLSGAPATSSTAKNPDTQTHPSPVSDQKSKATSERGTVQGKTAPSALQPLGSGPAAEEGHHGASLLDKLAPAAKPRKPVGTADEHPSFTIPPQTPNPSQDGAAGDQIKDWSFDSKETPFTAADVSTVPLNFEFPVEPVETPDSERKNTVRPNGLRAEPTPSRTVNKAQPSKSIGAAPKTQSSKPDPGVPPGLKKPAAKPDESRALVPANHHFDQRLIEDVIKNYGDFATVPNLPATLKSTPKIAPTIPTAVKPAKTDLNDAAENARKVLNVKKSGDLDRQLKKIIKDYGEYDIYQRKSVVSFRAGGIIAFAVLGLVLALLYLFRPSSAVSTPQTGIAPPPLLTERSLPMQDLPNAAPEQLGAGAMKATKNAMPTTETKQIP